MNRPTATSLFLFKLIVPFALGWQSLGSATEINLLSQPKAAIAQSTKTLPANPANVPPKSAINIPQLIPKPIPPYSKVTTFANPIPPISPINTSPTKPDTKKIYQVKPGETLYSISLKSGQIFQNLAKWNNLPSPYRVSEGQLLKLSDSSENLPPSVEKVKHLSETAKLTPEPINPKTKSEKTKSTPEKVKPASKKEKAKPEKAKLTPAATKPLSNKAKPSPRKATSPSESGKAKLTPMKERSGLIIKPIVPLTKKTPSLTIKTAPKTIISKRPISPEKKSSIPIADKKVLKLNFKWPLSGPISKSFSQSNNQGIDIENKIAKQSVLAAAAGQVVYIGEGLANLKNLIIIQHDAQYLTAYANNSKILVKEDQKVKSGQTIAEISAKGTEPNTLHFQIRKNGTPLNPLNLLPK